MPLRPEVKAERARQRMIEKAREYQTSTYSRKFVAPIFQKMIRAEAGAGIDRYVSAVVEGEISLVVRSNGYVVCITCGATKKWNARDINTGHFIAGRTNSILYEEDNVAPQCASCNQHHSGRPLEYRMWMEFIRGREKGEDVVGRLQRLKTESRSFDRDELVDMRIQYAARLKAAEERMRNPTGLRMLPSIRLT